MIIKKKTSKNISRKIASSEISAKEYAKLLEQLKKDIQQTQLRTAFTITKELITLYWRIGKILSERITNEKWGAKVIEKLAMDPRSSFPGVLGFSLRNLKYMRKFADCYQDANCATAVAQIPWGHNVIIMDRIKDPNQRLWYIRQTIENGWSRASLIMWIESELYSRQRTKTKNR
jgi:predicted nuclease of restriction endonuclease-like (RecB) superfamily